MSKCNFREAMTKIETELAKQYGDTKQLDAVKLQEAIAEARFQLIDSNPSQVPSDVLIQYSGTRFLKSGESNITKIKHLENSKSLSGIDSIKLSMLKEALWNESMGRDIDGRGKFFSKKDRDRNAARANSSLLGSTENVSWADKPFGKDDSVEMHKLSEHFRDVFKDLNESTLDDGHYVALQKTFENTVQVFIDAGVEIDYEFVQRVNDGNEHNMGKSNIENDQIQMKYGVNTDFFTPAEILLHEMQHLLVEKTLRSTAKFSNQIKRLRKTLLKDPNMNYKIFLTDKPNATQAQIDFAKKHFDYVFKNDKSTEGEFLVAATTNKYVMEAMDKYSPAIELVSSFDINSKRETNIALGKGDKRGDTAGTKFMRVANMLIDLINETYRNAIGTTGKSSKTVAEEILVELVKSAAISERQTKPRVESDNKFIRAFFAAEKKMSKVLKKLEDSYEDIEANGAKIRKKTHIAGWLDKITNHRKLIEFKNNLIVNGWVGSMLRDTEDPQAAWFFEMFRVAKKDLDIRVNEVKNSILHTFEREFGWENIGKKDGLRVVATNMLIRTDVRVLGEGVKELKVYLDDPDKLDADIKLLEKDMGKGAIAASDRLAYKMMHGKELSINGFKNAWEIERFHREGNALRGDKMAKIIDVVVTMKAIRFAGEADKEVMREALQDPKKAEMMQRTVNMYDKRMTNSLYSLYGNKPANMEKGQFRAHYDERRTTSIASEDDLPSLAKLKIFPVNDGKPLQVLTNITGKNYYMVAGPNLDSDYTKGIISTVGLGTEGDSLKATLYKIGYGIEEVDGLIKGLAKIEAGDEVVFDGMHNMTPDRNSFGVIEDYKFIPTVEEQYEHLGMKNDITHVLANTVSNMTNKETSVLNNIKAVNYMRAFYTDNKDDFAHEFIKIRPSTPDELKAGKPYKYAYLWDILPGYTQQHITSSNGNVKELMVHRDLVINFFGFKDASIANLPLMSRNHATKVSLKVVEDVLKAFVNRFKSVVVILTPETVKNNLVSNASAAMQVTHLSPMEYASRFKESWVALDSYHKNRKLMAIMDVKRDSKEKVDEVLYNSLAAENELSIVHDLFEDGQITQILEDIELSNYDSQSYTSKKIEKVFDNLPSGIKSFKEQIYMDQHTSSYEAAAKLTQYGDTINRVIIYNELKNSEPKRALLNSLDKLYVNYNYLDNKYIKWANDTGMLVFTKYTTRMIPVVWKMIKNNPVTTAFFQGGQELSGFDVSDIYDSYYSPWETLLHKFAWKDPKNMFEAVVTPIGVQIVTD